MPHQESKGLVEENCFEANCSNIEKKAEMVNKISIVSLYLCMSWEQHGRYCLQNARYSLKVAHNLYKNNQFKLQNTVETLAGARIKR
jgi:hypothetical protein